MANLPTLRQIAPSAANPNGAGVGIGDVFMDPTGAEPGFAIVQGPLGAQTLRLYAVSSPGRDVLSVVSSSTGAGNRTLTFTLRDALAALKPGAPFGLLLVGSGVIAVALTVGTGGVFASAAQAFVTGVTGGAGTFVVSVTGVAAATLDYQATNTSADPSLPLSGQVAFP